MSSSNTPWALALLAFVCNECAAPAGAPCTNRDGSPAGHFHGSRFVQRDRADRAEAAIATVAR